MNLHALLEKQKAERTEFLIKLEEHLNGKEVVAQYYSSKNGHLFGGFAFYELDGVVTLYPIKNDGKPSKRRHTPSPRTVTFEGTPLDRIEL